MTCYNQLNHDKFIIDNFAVQLISFSYSLYTKQLNIHILIESD